MTKLERKRMARVFWDAAERVILRREYCCWAIALEEGLNHYLASEVGVPYFDSIFRQDARDYQLEEIPAYFRHTDLDKSENAQVRVLALCWAAEMALDSSI